MTQQSAPLIHHSDISYRPDIDALRAIAVLSVVLCHADLAFPGGYVGVDVFFVISGFLISSLILKRITTGGFSLVDFWERRVRRILPALIVVVLCTLVAAGWIQLPADFASFGKSLIALSLSVSNFHFWRETDYFAGTADEKYLIHTWSLAVEEQFYIFLPLFLALMWRIGRLPQAFVLLTIAGILSFVLSVCGAFYFPKSTFYLLPTRAWELFVGVLLARLASRTVSPSPRLWQELAAILGLLLIIFPCLLYSSTTRFPGLAAAVPVSGAALVIWSGSASAQLPRITRLLACKPIVFVGLISYSLYLWHWPILVFARNLVIHSWTIQFKLFLVLVSVGVATLSWRCIETPFRKRDFIPPKAVFTFGGLSLCALFLIGISIRLANGFPDRISPERRIFAKTGELDRKFIHELKVEDIPNNLVQLGRPDVPARLLIWGDSHAMAVLPVIELLCHQFDTAALVATHSGTAPALGFSDARQIREHRKIEALNSAIVDFVQTSRIEAVLLIGHWSFYVDPPDQTLADALLQTVEALNANGARVYFMKDVPEYGYNVPSAMTMFYPDKSSRKSLGISLDEYIRQNKLQESLIGRLEERGVKLLDPIPLMIAHSESSLEIMPGDSNGSFYRDKDHLSTYGALALSPLFTPIVAATKDPGRGNAPTIIDGRVEEMTRIAPSTVVR